MLILPALGKRGFFVVIVFLIEIVGIESRMFQQSLYVAKDLGIGSEMIMGTVAREDRVR